MNEAFLVLLISFVTPFVVYVSVKLGTYAFFKGKDNYERDNHPEKENQHNGSNQARP